MKTLLERIAEHPFVLGMPEDHIAMLAPGAAEARFKPGDLIIREGEPANRLYLIESGAIALEDHEPGDGTFAIQTLTGGDVLGWSWLLSPYVWHFQARVLEPTTTLMLDAARLLVAAEENPVFGYELMKRTAHVLMKRMRSMRNLIRK